MLVNKIKKIYSQFKLNRLYAKFLKRKKKMLKGMKSKLSNNRLYIVDIDWFYLNEIKYKILQLYWTNKHTHIFGEIDHFINDLERNVFTESDFEEIYK